MIPDAQRRPRCAMDVSCVAWRSQRPGGGPPTIVDAIAGGRGLASQLRRAVAFYLGAKIALVMVVAVPLILGLPAPFDPVHIVILELFMDVGASVAPSSHGTAPLYVRGGAPSSPSTCRWSSTPCLKSCGIGS